MAQHDSVGATASPTVARIPPHRAADTEPPAKPTSHTAEFLQWLYSIPVEQRIKFYFSYAVVLGVGILAFIMFSITNIMIVFTGIWTEIAREHFAAIIGLPSAAAAALFLVLVLSTTAGRIEFEGLGFKFRGAAGPLVFWIGCFLAITAAIKILW